MAPEWLCKTSHVFVGFVAGLVPWAGPKLADMFVEYEEDEEKALERRGRDDPSYEEYREFIAGQVFGAVLSLVLIIILVLEVT